MRVYSLPETFNYMQPTIWNALDDFVDREGKYFILGSLFSLAEYIRYTSAPFKR